MQKIVPSVELVGETVTIATKIARMSPDSVIVSRAGIRQAMETASVERATQLNAEMFAEKVMYGENAEEGVRAFEEKRKPKCVPLKL